MEVNKDSHLTLEGRKYKRLLHYLTDYIYTVNIKDGKVVDTEHGIGCFAVTGYKSGDYKKDPTLWYSMVHKKDRDTVIQRAEAALNGERVEPLEHRIIHRNGSVRWVRNTIVHDLNINGPIDFYDGLITDITDRKVAEDRAESRQQQLIHADKMISLGILVSGVAHEINNPNNFIMLNSQYIIKLWEEIQPILNEYYEEKGDFVVSGMMYSDARNKVVPLLKGILNGSKRIQKIVGSLSEFSHKDKGELDSEVNINRAVKNAAIIVGNLIKNSTDKFNVEYGESLPAFLGNEQQIEQVIINLIANACQSLNGKDKAINIFTSYRDDKKSIYFRIEDEGRGIEDEDLQRIMDPFFTTKRDSGGTGLGLSISYNIIKKHGGKIKLKSRMGKGTRISIRIPIRVTEENN
ncbi:MAG: PAS domain-containing sensor histidine kinase [Melioribacteraceae bacterium]|nr:PAS domain-containing sensor histidine kinase [Melioribacteraceae bacterium]